jgi:hypothetical protein
MDCRDVRELAVERLTGEAGEKARAALSAHLATCERCREEMAALESVWAKLGSDPNAPLRPEFRRRTLALLDEEILRQRVRAFRPRPRLASPLLRAAALLLAAGLGYVAARALPPRANRVAAAPAVARSSAALPDLQAGPRLSNVSYQTADRDGRVGIGFDVTMRHTVVGRPDEPEVAKLLAYLVSRNAETAGEKSRAIELVSEHFGAGSPAASPEILAALSNTLRRDPNPGVRKKAADALANFTMSPEIRTVFLEALRSDKNPAVRLVAVDALAAAAKQAPDARTIESLREKAADPQENGFVRAKAASALKAISF